MRRTLISAALLLCVGVSAPVLAGWPEGEWELKGFLDTGWNQYQVTQKICILPGGSWYSTTFPDWNGNYFIKGNDLHMNGAWATAECGADSFELTKIGNWHMDGYWQEFDAYGAIYYLTVKWEKKSNACAPPADAAVDPGTYPGDSKDGGR